MNNKQWIMNNDGTDATSSAVLRKGVENGVVALIKTNYHIDAVDVLQNDVLPKNKFQLKKYK